MLKRFHNFLLAWKPLHLCWWFRKHSLPIPRYFIGGSGSAPSVTTNAATSVGAASAQLNGQITSDGGRTLLTAGFALSSTDSTPTLGEGGVTDVPHATPAVETYAETASSLSGSTQYWYQAYASNDKGTSYGGVQTFTTNAPVAPTVTTQAVSGIGDNTATGNGNVTSSGGATVTERGVVANTTGTPTTSDLKFQAGAGGTGAYTASMTSLGDETFYYVRAYAINSAGTSYGSEVNFTTAEQEPTVALNTPADTAAGVSTTPNLLFTGTDPGADEIEYEVQVDPNNTFDSTPIPDTIAFDAATTSTEQTTSPITVNHTTSGANRLLISGVTIQAVGAQPTATGVTYNGVAMTKARADQTNNGTVYIETSVWLLHAPATGSNSVSATINWNGGSSTSGVVNNVSYTNAQQTSTADAVNGLVASGTGSKTFTVTTTASGCWIYVAGIARGSGPTLTANQTSRGSGNLGAAATEYEDTNGSQGSPGAKTVGMTVGGTATESLFTGVSFAPSSSNGPLLDKFSETPDATFSGTGDPHPWPSGNQVTYTVQAGDALNSSTTYYWRVRGKDPTGSDTYGNWSSTRSFTTAGGATNYTFNASAQTITASLPQETVTAQKNITINANVQVLTSSLPSRTITIGDGAAPATQVVTTSIPAYSVQTSAIQSAQVQQVTTSLPTYTPQTSAVVSVSTQTLTSSVPTRQVQISDTINPSTQLLTTSLPSRTISISESNTANVQTVTTSIPTYSVVTDAAVNYTFNASTQILTTSLPQESIVVNDTTAPTETSLVVSIPTYTVSASSILSANTQVLTTSLPQETVTAIKNATINANVQSITTSMPTYSVVVSDSTAPTETSLTVSIPTYSVVTSSVISASTQVLTTSIPTYTAGAFSNVTVNASVQTVSTSLPQSTASSGSTISANTQLLTGSIQTYTQSAIKNVSVSAGVQALTSSVPGRTVSVGDGATPATQTLSVGIPAYSVSTSSAVSANTQLVSVSVPTYSVDLSVPYTFNASTQTVSASLPTSSLELGCTVNAKTLVLGESKFIRDDNGNLYIRIAKNLYTRV